jgi:hypothetical protein
MTYKLNAQYAGYPPIPGKYTTELVRGGDIYPVEDPVYGGGEVLFARANGVIPVYGLCVFTPVWDATNFRYTYNATAVPNTAGLGRTLGVAMAGVALAAADYAWFLVSGIAPINGTASVAADTAFGITAAGQIGAIGNGKQVLNARVVTAATNTVAKAGTGISGSNQINFAAGNAGYFEGGVLTGTGVGSAAVVSFVDPMGAYILASVVNAAAINGTVTQTANDATIFFNVAAVNRPFAQGQVA